MRQVLTPVTGDERQEGPTCRHHWVIEMPNGPTSRGVCKRCGAEREFKNSSEDYIWDHDALATQAGRWRGRGGPGAGAPSPPREEW